MVEGTEMSLELFCCRVLAWRRASRRKPRSCMSRIRHVSVTSPPDPPDPAESAVKMMRPRREISGLCVDEGIRFCRSAERLRRIPANRQNALVPTNATLEPPSCVALTSSAVMTPHAMPLHLILDSVSKRIRAAFGGGWPTDRDASWSPQPSPPAIGIRQGLGYSG